MQINYLQKDIWIVKNGHLKLSFTMKYWNEADNVGIVLRH